MRFSSGSPEGVAADVSGQVGLGALQVGDQDRGGIGVEADLGLEGLAGTLVLDANVGIGQVVVQSWPAPPPEPDLQGAYTLANGSLRLDLGGLVLEEDRSVSVDVGRGEVWVTVPEDLGLRITIRVDRGRLTLFDEVWEGSNLNATHSTYFSGTHISGAPRLTLDIRLGEGSVTVEEER